jgi:hypothetical protein
MQSRFTRPLVALGLVAALGLPAAAVAHGKAGQHGKKPDKSGQFKGQKGRALNVKGTVTAIGDGTIDVLVKHANHHGRALNGQTVTFDVSNARIVVRDVNGDGSRDLADVAVGDRVDVHSRIAKGATPDTSQPVVARHVVDKGQEAASGGDGTGGDQTGGDQTGDGTDTPPTP